MTKTLIETRAVSKHYQMGETLVAVLLVTHDHDLAARFADRTIMLKDGKVQSGV